MSNDNTFITGIDEVLLRFSIHSEEMRKNCMKGLVRAQILIRRDMDFTSPTIPIDFGNLRASYSSHGFWINGDPFITMQFGASYAWWVHEMVGAHFQKDGSGAKFFEASLKRNEDKAHALIEESMRKGV